jgi:hypothetical protein
VKCGEKAKVPFLKQLAAHLEGSRGTLLCPGTLVENHWSFYRRFFDLINKLKVLINLNQHLTIEISRHELILKLIVLIYCRRSLIFLVFWFLKGNSLLV